MATPAATFRPDLAEAIDAFVHVALGHRAVRHPFLLRDDDAMLRSYARAMHGCVAWHGALLEAAMQRVPGPQRLPWQRQLAREQGHLDDADIAELRARGIAPTSVLGRSRAELFARFVQALDRAEGGATTPSTAAERWRMELLLFLRQASPGQAIGALVLGGNELAPATSRPVLRALLAHGLLRTDELVWFELQTLGEERHRADLRELVASQLLVPGGRDALRSGLVHALRLQAEFFDRLQAATSASNLARTA